MTSEPMTPERLAGIRERGPVGYHCDHSDEPYDARTHHAWEYVEDEGFVFQHLPDVVSANWGPRDHLSPERRKQRCPRALPVYDVDVPALLDEVVEARRDAHTARIDYNLARTRADKAEAQLSAVWALVEPWRSADSASPDKQNLVYRLLAIRDRAEFAALPSSPTGEQGEPA